MRPHLLCARPSDEEPAFLENEHDGERRGEAGGAADIAEGLVGAPVG